MLGASALISAPALELKPNARIVFVGNTFAERLNDAGYFESLLTSRFPKDKLTFRNLGWSGDSLTESNLRPLNFGEQMMHLHEQKPDVIFACYGMVESFAGDAKRGSFEEALGKWVDAQLSMDYSGHGKPAVVLVSPICHEQLGGKFPDPSEHNRALAAYTITMRKVADLKKVGFIDLFTPTEELMREAAAEKLTFNGIHLTDFGNWVVAQLMVDALGFSSEAPRVEEKAMSAAPFKLQLTLQKLPAPPPPKGVRPPAALLKDQPLVTVKGLPPGRYGLSTSGKLIAEGDDQDFARGIRLSNGPAAQQAERLLAAIEEKNRWFFHRYRPLNGEYIFGRRAKPFGVVNFPGEMKQLDDLLADWDQKIWSLAVPPSPEALELAPLRD